MPQEKSPWAKTLDTPAVKKPEPVVPASVPAPIPAAPIPAELPLKILRERDASPDYMAGFWEACRGERCRSVFTETYAQGYAFGLLLFNSGRVPNAATASVTPPVAMREERVTLSTTAFDAAPNETGAIVVRPLRPPFRPSIPASRPDDSAANLY